jgi:hypothetical protein
VEAERPAHRFAAVLAVSAAFLLVAATLFAARSGAAGRTVLGGGEAAIEAVIAAGEVLLRTLRLGMGSVRLPALVVCLLWLARLLRLPAERRGAQPLVAALGLGWIAQSFLLEGRVVVGLVLYAGVIAAVALERGPPAAPAPLAPRLEMAAILVLLALFTGLCLYRLDVHPNLYVDEMAYLRAARMFAGQVEVGRILGRGPYELYVYDQFVAQTIPLLLQAAAVSFLPSDVIATRLLSVVAVAVALLVGVVALRQRLGPRVTLWMLALSACAPLVVVYARAGHYISISLLHAVVCFAALLWLLRRWDLPAALVVGVLLGGSLYQYQLSWFVPVFAGVMFLASPSLWRRPRVVRVVATVATAGAVTVLPGLAWLDTGFDAVNAQTFDRAVWNVPMPGDPASPHDTLTGVLVIVPESVDEAGREAFVAGAERRGLSARPERSVQGEWVIWVGGDRPQVEALAGAARGDAWPVLDFDWITKNPFTRLGQMLEQLFYTPGWESSGRWVGAPLLNPALVPLLLLGLALAWRRRCEPALRLLLIWVVGGALLPAVVGGPAPRRTSLMLPFAYAAMALPLVEIAAELRRRRPWGRPAAAALAAALFAAVACSGCFVYFRQWDQQTGLPGAGGGILDFVKVLKTRPVDEVVLMPAMFRGLDNYLDAGDASWEWPERVSRPLKDRPLMVVRGLSCRRPAPFTWMAQDTAEHRAALAWVEKHFVVESEVHSGIRVLRAVAARDAVCNRGSGPGRHPAAAPAE